MNQFELLKAAVRRQVASLPASTGTLVAVLDRPMWQVEAALNSLSRAGLIVLKRGHWRVGEQPNARRRV